MSKPAVRSFTRDQFEKMIAAGIFHPEERLELIEGSIIKMTPQSSRHAAVVQLVERALAAAYGDQFSVRVQMPLGLGSDSEPEPDIAVVTGGPRDYLDAHPVTAALVVEVADTSLALDRDRKMRLYARKGIPEYWVLNLVGDVVEVYREATGESYRRHSVLRRGDRLPANGPRQSTIDVDDVLP